MNRRNYSGDGASTQTMDARESQVEPANDFLEFHRADVEQSLPERFEQQVRRYPGRIAVTSRGGRLTYEELNDQANRVAHAILDERGERTETVALLLEPGPSMIAALMGVLKAGKIVVPLDAAYPPERIRVMLGDAEAPLVITSGQQLIHTAESAGGDHRVLNLDALDTRRECWNPALPISPGALADVVYTSGSTGRPKGIARTHRMLLYGARLYTNSCHLSCDDRLSLLHSLSFAAGIAELFNALMIGASVNQWDVRSQGLDGMAEWMLRERISVFHWFPTAFRHFVDTLNGDEQFPDLRLIILGSEAVLDRDVQLYRRHFSSHALLANRLGTSETLLFCMQFADASTVFDGSTMPVGYELDGKEVSILDDDGNELGVDEVGEIAVRSSFISPGYWKRPDLTEKAFLPDPDGGDRRIYKTGDLGFLRPNGCLEYLGRKDTQVKIRGHRVEVSEIESLLLNLDSVRDAVVVPRVDDNGEMQLAAFVVPACPQPLSTRELKRPLAERLPTYMVPSSFNFLDRLPLTPSGKVDRRSLPEVTFDRADPDRKMVPPRNEVETTLAEIWAKALRLECVGVRDDFFELGGHSLTATHVIREIRESFNVELPLVQLFESPTVEALARKIETLRESDAPPAAVNEPLPQIVSAPGEQHLPFPLTDIQQAYWVGRSGSFELGNVTTHSYVEVDCPDLDFERLEQTWRRLIQRHGMLRAIVNADGRQQILEQVPDYEIKVVDLRDLDPASVERETRAVRERMSHQVLPSEQWPLFEICACRLGERHYLLHFSFDALILDAWSRAIVFKEWRSLYESPERELPPLELTFRDYVLAERALRESDRYKRARQYWLDRLPELPGPPELPLAKSPSSIKDPRFERRATRLDADCWGRLKRRAARSGLTGSGVLMAAFSEILKRWSRHPRFAINLTLYNRLPLHEQVNDVVGDFTSLMLLEVDNSRDDSFESRARRLEAQFWNDLDHGDYGAVELLREMARSQGGGPKASMPVVFTSLLNQADEFGVGQKQFWMGQLMYRVAQTPQVWLDHVTFEENGELALSWDAVEDLFPRGMLDDMFDSYCCLLKELADDDDVWQRPWDDVAEALLPRNQRVLLDSVNATDAPQPGGLLQSPFVAQVQQKPDHPAVVSSERTLSYQQLWNLSNRIGRTLQRSGAQPNRLVAVVMDKGWEQVPAVLGTLQAGAAYLPIDAKLPEQRIHRLLELGEVELVLTQSHVDASLNWPDSVRRMCVDVTKEWEDVGDSALNTAAKPEDLAYVIFTSGSTGEPKGVAIDHCAALNTIVDVNQRFHVASGDRVLALSSLGFDLSVYDIFGVLAAGGTVVMPEASAIRNPARWAELMKQHEVTLWNSVPALMELLVEWVDGREGLLPESLRLVLLSGDWIPVTLPGQLRELLPQVEIISLGGATEASIWSILYPIHDVDPAWPSIPYGKAMTNQSFHVLNEAMETCPVLAVGELYIGGVGLARCYWGNPATTGARFVTHPRTHERLYRTGDLGRFLPDGNIEFLGREDFQVKIQGHRIELGEIEAALVQHGNVKQAVVTAVGDSTSERRLVAYFVAEDDAPPTTDDLRNSLQKKLPGYMIPAQFVALEQLPLTSNGKVDRKALPAPGEPDSSGDGQPRNEAQIVASSGNAPLETVSQLVCDVMCLSDIDAKSNLLNVGATSIDMIRIVNLLEKRLEFRPSINDFYREPTIAYLVEAWTAAGGNRSDDSPSEPMSPPPRDPAGYLRVLDPMQRSGFKEAEPGLRRFEAERTAVALSADDLGGSALTEALSQRRSHRQFADRPIPAATLGRVLATLRRSEINGKPKYRYGSAGGLYPVQTYLFVKPDRVADVPGGSFYYDPAAHRLVLLCDDTSFDGDLFDPFLNAPVYEEAAFGLFLVADLKAIAPMYGEWSLHYAAVEAGMIAQLLELAGPEHGLGFCQIGTFNFEPLRPRFALGESHVPVHTLLGGLIESATSHLWSPFLEGSWGGIHSTDDREEGIL